MLTPAPVLTASLLFATAALANPAEIRLWDRPVVQHSQAETAEDKRETGRQDRWLSYVSEPALTLYPAPGGASAAPLVIVVPGGGFRYVCIDKEGVEPATWLNRRGISVAVLKYRTIDPKAERSRSSVAPVFADMERAVRVLRHRAGEFGIDPKRIGVLGFSAGAVMALRLTADADAGDPAASDPVERFASHANAIGIVYGGTMGKLKPPPTLPPFFIVHAVDDPKAPVSVVSSITDYVREAKGSYEVHLFHRGDHGFGILPPTGTVRAWPDLYAAWLDDIGFTAR